MSIPLMSEVQLWDKVGGDATVISVVSVFYEVEVPEGYGGL